jgi:hypothetical protein
MKTTECQEGEEAQHWIPGPRNVAVEAEKLNRGNQKGGGEGGRWLGRTRLHLELIVVPLSSHLNFMIYILPLQNTRTIYFPLGYDKIY